MQCTCGSAVLFDKPRPPWPEHDCRTSGSLGGSGLSGWAAVDVLRAHGVPIDAGIRAKVFAKKPSTTRAAATAVDETKAIEPASGQKVGLLAVVRDLLTDTKRTSRLNSLGAVGSRMLRLPGGTLWQLTLVANSERPNRSYTCVIPASLELARDARNKMVFAQLEARIAGPHAVWLVTEIQLI
jgi:hypothetical protein